MTASTPQPYDERANGILQYVRCNPLDVIFIPGTVAVIRATEKPGSVECAVLKQRCVFGTTGFPVNSRYTSTQGIDSLSPNPDTAMKTTAAILEKEKALRQ